MLGLVFRTRREEMVMSLMVVLVLLILSATLMFEVEHDAQPHVFSSIPATLWWAVATLTTIGYGDVYPVTVAGRVIGSVVSLLGIGVFALPAGILASGFVEVRGARRRGARDSCPTCGRPFAPVPPGRGSARACPAGVPQVADESRVP
jgi:voltage-gated potassium channel